MGNKQSKGLFDLPQEIVIKILLLLPSKTLLRCKSVCKTWQKIVSNPCFMQEHLRYHSSLEKPSVLIMCREDPSEEYACTVRCIDAPNEGVLSLNLPFSPIRIDKVYLVGYCDGLLCLSVSLSASVPNVVYLWNPSTMKWCVLPDSNFSSKSMNYLNLGFCVDRAGADYKVVKVSTSDLTRYMLEEMEQEMCNVFDEMEVYSLGTNSWRIVHAAIPRELGCIEYSKPFTCDGSIYWIGLDFKEPYCKNLVLFDMAEEVFRCIQLPDCISLRPMHIGLQSGNITLICFIPFQVCEIWVMKDGAGVQSWTKQHVITQNEVIELMHSMHGVTRSGEVLIETRHGRLVSYDIEKNMTKDMGVFFGPYSCCVATYAESLISVCSGRNELSSAVYQKQLSKCGVSSLVFCLERIRQRLTEMINRQG